MPRDRLAELKSDAGEIQHTAVIDMEPPAGGAADGKDVVAMKEFFAEVDQIKAGVAAIKRKVQDIEQMHNKALTAVSGADKSADGPKSLDALMDATNADIQSVRSKLKAMDTKNKKLGADPEKPNLTADQRMRLSQHGNVTKKFVEAVTEYQDLQQKYKGKYRDRLERQFKIVKPNATAEEIEQAMESGADGSTVFAQQILMGAQHAEAKRALYDIQERHQDIIKIEKSILELHQLFVDMAVLVDAQGEMLNQIEHYVGQTADHTNRGVDEMKKAVKSQKKSRKKMCCLIFILLILIIVVIVVSSIFA